MSGKEEVPDHFVIGAEGGYFDPNRFFDEG
jgi:hypothetical protein